MEGSGLLRSPPKKQSCLLMMEGSGLLSAALRKNYLWPARQTFRIQKTIKIVAGKNREVN